VALQGGEVKAESAGLGRGTTFTVRFPAMAAPEPEPRWPASAQAGGAETILVVEDHDDGRESLCLALKLQGHRVLPAADGPAALDLLRRERASVAILDIGLPGMDGYQFARRSREAFGRQIVLIALTGYGLETDAEKAMQAGFDRHLTKPVDLQKLAQAIEIAERSRQAVASD
jgi:CheY-like chemotaxis protein